MSIISIFFEESTLKVHRQQRQFMQFNTCSSEVSPVSWAVVNCLPSIHEVLGLISRTTKQNKKPGVRPGTQKHSSPVFGLDSATAHVVKWLGFELSFLSHGPPQQAGQEGAFV